MVGLLWKIIMILTAKDTRSYLTSRESHTPLNTKNDSSQTFHKLHRVTIDCGNLQEATNVLRNNVYGIFSC